MSVDRYTSLWVCQEIFKIQFSTSPFRRIVAGSPLGTCDPSSHRILVLIMVLDVSFIYGLGLKSNPSVVGYFHDVHATVGHIFARPAVLLAHSVDAWVPILAFIL